MRTPLSPGAGNSPLIAARIPKAAKNELDEALARADLTQAELVRLFLSYGLRHIDDVLAYRDSEVSAKAS